MPKTKIIPGIRTPRQVLVGLTSILSMVLSLAVGLGAPTQAQAFSNAGAFSFGSSQVIVEDVAICTKYQYPFDPSSNGGFTWNQTGYETCPSEVLTVNSLPATLHLKFRVQSINPEEFLASNADAFISDSKGVRVNTPRWAPSPLIDLDGAFNQRDGIYYAAFSIADPKIFQVGSYFLNIQFWNGQWIKVNGPNLAETPRSFSPFSFNILSGSIAPLPNSTASPSASPSPSGNSNNNSCAIDSSFEDYLNTSKATLEGIYRKTNPINDFSSPGLMSLLERFMDMVKEERAKIVNITNKFADFYKDKQNCSSYINFQDSSNSIATQAANTQSLLDAFYAKAKAMSTVNQKNDNSDTSCDTRGNALLADIKKSYSQISVYGEKLKGPFDLTSRSVVDMLAQWSRLLDSEAQNLTKYRSSLKELAAQDPECGAYPAGVAMIDQATTRYAAATKAIDGWNEKIDKNLIKQESSNEDSLAEDDGFEEDPIGTLSVTYSTAQGRFILRVESNLPEESLTVRATKRGSKPLRFTINTDEDGDGGIRTRTKLNGYTLVLLFGTEKLDQLRVR